MSFFELEDPVRYHLRQSGFHTVIEKAKKVYACYLVDSGSVPNNDLRPPGEIDADSLDCKVNG